VAVETVEGRDPGRPRGKRFGVLVHAALAEVELDAAAPEIDALARLHGRSIGASAAEIDAAAIAVRAALAHPLLRRAAAAEARGDCRRETPLLYRLADGSVLEGVVDLAFREDGAGWTIVDFKTDAEIEASLAAYEAQVRLYAAAIAAASGEPARGTLLRV
jgi:ATP-dependent exoDNAse (exonuclease V) beta subunit